MFRTLRRLGAAALFPTLGLGCAPSGAEPEGAETAVNSAAAGPALPAVPWSEPPLGLAEVPSVYFAEWSRAENREHCALLALSSPPYHDQATPRAATFAGGWGVAYDLPRMRSAFGIAGTGADADAPDLYADWPYRLEWSDGSTAGYGPEGGIATKQLAYLTIAGERCLYNLWSWFSPEHLAQLLEAVRRVDVAEASP